MASGAGAHVGLFLLACSVVAAASLPAKAGDIGVLPLVVSIWSDAGQFGQPNPLEDGSWSGQLSDNRYSTGREVRHSVFQRLFIGVPTGTFLGMALAALWFDELLIEVFPRALVLGERRVFPFQLIVGYDPQKHEHLELNIEYIPAGKLGGGNSYVEIRLPPDRGDYFAALLDERCPGISRTRQFRNRYPETTEEPDAEDEF